MKGKPWSGRFSQETEKLVERFTSSVDVDARLYLEDIEASKAHARMLGRRGILGEAEVEAILGGLDAIRQDIESGSF
ncbi:MAG TPA: lyase family protein, partial [Deltaproteobacteria bacterium]|nr:lyase family protein [Deltaproteobacteria bacterium]